MFSQVGELFDVLEPQFDGDFENCAFSSFHHNLRIINVGYVALASAWQYVIMGNYPDERTYDKETADQMRIGFECMLDCGKLWTKDNVNQFD